MGRSAYNTPNPPLALEGDRRETQLKLNTLFLGFLDFSRAGRQFVLFFHGHDGYLLRAQSESGSGRVHGGIPAADYYGSVPDLARAFQIDFREELDTIINAFELFSGNIEPQVAVGSSGE